MYRECMTQTKISLEVTLEGWSKVSHFTDWINKYTKLLEYIKVEDILRMKNNKEIKEKNFERENMACLQDIKIIHNI